MGFVRYGRLSVVLTMAGAIAVACGGTLPAASGNHDGGAGAEASNSAGGTGGGAGASAGSDASAGDSAAAGTGGADGSGGAGGSSAAGWAAWPMPNPVGAGLPNPASYDTTTPGVVLDNVTGLMWERAVGLGSHTWADANAYCGGLVLAGRNDWRLPTEIELLSLVDYTKSKPAIDPTSFPNTPAGAFWSSTPFVQTIDPNQILFVNFQDGGMGPASGATTDDHEFLARVRCVASNTTATAPPGRYSIANGTVTDKDTKLVWQQAADGGSWTWSDAKSYCASLALDGGGWRVPSVKELMTLVDFNATAEPAMNLTAFPSALADARWSSSLVAGSSASMAWYVIFSVGWAQNAGTSPDTHAVRCVR